MSVRESLSDILPGGSGRGRGGSSPSSPDAGDGGDAGGGNNNGDDPVVDVRVHAILQYPRCYDELFASKSYLDSPNFPIKYGSCAEEEDALDPSVKGASAGGIIGVGGASSSSSSSSSTSPLLDKDGAWKRSYRALEEMYHHGSLESIGVGDFGPEDMRQLFELATVGPHVYQGSLRTLLTQEGLIEELVRRGVHYQCHDAASAVLGGRDGAPLAYARLERIGAGRGGGPATADLEGGGGRRRRRLVGQRRWRRRIERGRILRIFADTGGAGIPRSPSGRRRRPGDDGRVAPRREQPEQPGGDAHVQPPGGPGHRNGAACAGERRGLRRRAGRGGGGYRGPRIRPPRRRRGRGRRRLGRGGGGGWWSRPSSTRCPAAPPAASGCSSSIPIPGSRCSSRVPSPPGGAVD